MIKHTKKFLPGQLYLILIILLFVMVIFLTGLHSRIGYYIGSSGASLVADQATSLADAGIDVAVNKINSNPSYTGETLNKPPLQTGQVIISVLPTGQTKTVTSTGCIPACSNARAKRTVTVVVERPTLQVSFPYALHGLENIVVGAAVTVNSVVNAVTGNVYSNKDISCSGPLPQVTGTPYYVSGTAPTCGNPASPVLAKDAPILNIGNGTTSGWKKAAADGNGGIPMDCTLGCTWTDLPIYPLGPIKILGNVTVGQSTNVRVTGPIWITGNLTVSSASTPASLSLDDSLDTCGGSVIAVDGTITLTGNAAITASAGPPKHYLILAQTAAVAGNGISFITTFSTLPEAIFYSADQNGKKLSDISFSGAGLTVINGTAVGKRVFVTDGARLSTGAGLTNAKFCGLSNTFVVQRGSYKISK